MPRVLLTATAHTQPGAASRPNQDAVLVREFADGCWVAAVADGVGGARAGGEAARRTLEMLADYWAARPQAWTPRRALAEFLQRINRQLYLESADAFGAPELVTTLTVAIVSGARLYGANVGDSPLLLWRKGRLLPLSRRDGDTTPGQEHVLTRAVGLSATLDPHGCECDLEPGDRVLLCTDGVAEPLGFDALQLACARGAAARSLVTGALDVARSRGDADDATALVLEVTAREETDVGEQALEVCPPLEPGRAFADGTLVRPLDAAARVWLAETGDGGRVILKFPPIEAAQDPARADGFLREAWQAARLAAPEFVRSRVPPSPRLAYYIQDYIDAPSLREVLQRGPLPVEGALALADFLVRAIQALVQRDLAHGDLKPDNLLVVQAGPAWEFRLIDLGSVGELFSVTSRAGTASYLAPERFHHAPLSERTEIFSIGVVIFEALTGRLPFGEIERYQTPRFPDSARPPSQENPAIPGWLDALVLRALSPDPARRYAHLSELAHDLRNPKSIQPFHASDAPLLERNPVRFYQLLSALLAAALVAQWWWFARPGR